MNAILKEKEMSQSARILHHMQSGRKITALYALREYACFRLAARINDLRNDGHCVESEPYSYKTESGETKTISQYYMPPTVEGVELSCCCSAKIVYTDLCSACLEHCHVEKS